MFRLFCTGIESVLLRRVVCLLGVVGWLAGVKRFLKDLWPKDESLIIEAVSNLLE